MDFAAKGKEKNLEGLVDEEHIEKGIDPAGNCARIISDSMGYMLTAEPVDAGQSAEVRVLEPISRHGKKQVSHIVLYEDGQEVASKKGFFLSHEINKQEEGTYEYHAELYRGSDESISTDTLNISFSGKKRDFLPFVNTYLTSTHEAGRATNIIVEGGDIGDNKGIRRITLYEDGIPYKEEENRIMVETVHHDTPGTHEYYAEIEDMGGQVVTTKPMKVSYSGEAYPPSVRWFHANPRQAGKTTRVLVDAKDEMNYDDSAGIERITLYEDNEKIHEQESDTLLHDVTHEEASTHLYHAEVKNKNGRVTESEGLEVSFLGHDFPPKVRTCLARYDAEKESVTVLMEGHDTENVRDDAGIRDIFLYEDGKAIAKEQGATLLRELERPEGLHTYHALITNNSGYTVQTDDVVAGYEKE